MAACSRAAEKPCWQKTSIQQRGEPPAHVPRFAIALRTGELRNFGANYGVS